MSKNRCRRCLQNVSRRIPCFIAWSLLLVLSTAYFIFLSPWIKNEISIQIPIVQLLILIFVVNNLILATFTDPGRYSRALPDENDDSETSFYKIVEIHGTQCRMKWCQTCGFYRPPRCSHCSVCDFCIDAFDHHCPWLNNCVGRRNYRYFICFLIGLLCHMFLVLSMTIYYLFKNHSNLSDIKSIISIVLIVFILLLTIPIGGLTLFHFMLILRGRTTNEQVTGKFKSNLNPFDYGITNNCLRIFSSSKPPKFSYRPKTNKRAKSYLKNECNETKQIAMTTV